MGGTWEPGGPSHGGDECRSPDGLDPRQAPGQLLGINRSIALLSGLLVEGQLGLERLEEPDLGGHLGSQVGEGHAGVLAIELEGAVGCGQPFSARSGLMLAMGARGDDLGEPSLAHFDQFMGVGPAFEDIQVGQRRDHRSAGSSAGSWRTRSLMRFLCERLLG